MIQHPLYNDKIIIRVAAKQYMNINVNEIEYIDIKNRKAILYLYGRQLCFFPSGDEILNNFQKANLMRITDTIFINASKVTSVKKKRLVIGNRALKLNASKDHLNLLLNF